MLSIINAKKSNQGKITSRQLLIENYFSLFKVVVHMMTYLIKNSDKIKDEESYNMKLENYQFLAKDLMKTFNTLERTQTKHLSKLKEALDDLQKVFLADQKAQDRNFKGGSENLQNDCPDNQKTLDGNQKGGLENLQQHITDDQKTIDRNQKVVQKYYKNLSLIDQKTLDDSLSQISGSDQVQNYLLEDQTALKNYQNEESSVAQQSNSGDLQKFLLADLKKFDHKTI